MEKGLKFAFRITHIDNIPHIVRCGLVRADSPLRDKNYVSIGDGEIIALRGERVVKGYRLKDYIPFYFGPRSPMLYVIQHGYNGVRRVDPEKIVYCVIRLDDLVNNDVDCVFTDGHALSLLSDFHKKAELGNIDTIIKFDDVYSSQWDLADDRDLKRRKEAELLVKNDLPAQYLRGYVVYNEKAKHRLMEMGVAESMIVVRPDYYF